MHTQDGGYPYRFALFLISYYVTNSVFQGFMSLYYTARGFSAGQIGVIYACIALVSLIAQPIWGITADRSNSKNNVLRLLAACAMLSMLAYLLAKSFLPLLMLACLFSVFYTSIQPMGDSIILEALYKGGRKPFGPIRLMACLSFAVASMLFGRIITQGHETRAIYCTAALCGGMFFATWVLPRTPGMQAVGGRRMSFSTLLKNRELMLLMLFAMLLQITMGYFYTFFSPHFVSLPGGTSALLGWCYFLSAVSETPFLLNSDRLFRRFGAGKLMCVSALMLSLRWIIVASCDNALVVMLSQLLHSMGFIVITVTSSLYIDRTVPPELKASGQMLLAVVSFGVARVAGNLGGGLLADWMGRQNVFYLCAILCGISFLCFTPYYLRHKPLNGEA
ncbi:MAG: MFS transporter [Eubacteriales bacterium]|nr:MFS transporter [Eubacteriales bacterium]